MYWLRRHVGSAGPGRQWILSQLFQALPKQPCAPDSAGLEEKELCRLSKDYRFLQLARAFPSRGDVTQLTRIAWLGSVLGDIASAQNESPREILQEAALFNVAVALFDTVIDDHPGRAAELCKALRPEKFYLRLKHPEEAKYKIFCKDKELNLIAKIFDDLFIRIGKRFQADEAHRENLYLLLKEMYESETGTSPDPMKAKHLPVVFIGELAGSGRHKSLRHFFSLLSTYLYMRDDWADLIDDMMQCAPNSFLSPSKKIPILYYLAYHARSLKILLLGGLNHPSICKSLARAQKKTLQASPAVGPKTLEKTVYLCRYLNS